MSSKWSIAAGALFFSATALATSIDWSGTYRFEYSELSSAYLTSVPTAAASDSGRKSAFLNHLNLTPKIVATDSMNIVSNIEVFPSAQYPGSQMGSDFSGAPSGNATGTGVAGTVTQGEGTASTIEVNQLYLNWNQEYGALVIGRQPLQFGLGISHNAGTGMFDHWIENHDLVAYKMIFGNLSLTPMIGRLNHGYGFAAGSQGTEMILNLDYTNTETESTIALFHEMRNAGPGANDAWRFFSPYDGNNTTGPLVVGALSTTLTNLYFARGWDSFKFRMEAGFMSGNTGIQYTTYNGVAGANVNSLSGYGIALEMEFPRPDSKWKNIYRLGLASGDNPQTQNYEGFFFNKNYDVAMLLFNTPMGQNSYDVLRSRLGKQRIPGTATMNTTYDNARTGDEEYVSNAIYYSPRFNYTMSDKWDWTGTVTYATTQINPSITQSSVGSDLGVEVDTGFVYKPVPKVQWVNQIGIFAPGSAWKQGAANYDVWPTVWGWE